MKREDELGKYVENSLLFSNTRSTYTEIYICIDIMEADILSCSMLLTPASISSHTLLHNSKHAKENQIIIFIPGNIF